ncbi:MAG: WD40 repeat domain-containing protein, partial [Pseudonocardiaceae bacterium]
AKQNGLAITRRLGPGARHSLAGVDLRGQDLTNRDLRNANLHGADLRGIRLVDTNLAGANPRDANLTGARMVRGELGGAQIAGSRWNRTALLDVSGLGDLTAAPELAAAAVAGRDSADVMIAPAGEASGVALSPDGALLAVTRGQGVEIIDLASGDVLRVLNGHTNGVTGVAFSPDGALLATASWDNTTRLWNPATGHHHTTLHGHTRRVTGVAFSPDNTLLATASADGTVRLWDPRTGSWRATLLALEASGYAVLLPEGSYKLDGDAGRSLWWAIKLCRFAPGELDPYDPAIQRLPTDAPILH